jgi:serine/threonine-protein kinase
MRIASGGMATVYLARSVGSNGFVSEVALKLTHEHLRTSAEFANDLVEEAKLAARIRHRNVVSVIDVADDATGLYLVMEYIEGDTLAGLIRGRESIPKPMGVRLLLDALAGLHAAHEVREDDGGLAGVVHRDFTPQNILVGTDGVARLADFGIAKAATRAGHTRTGIVKGKIAYMAPEQAHGTKLDRRCDVWAAGVVAWELFAGKRLHAGEDDISTLLRVATERPPLLRTVVPELPEGVEAVVAKALTMDVEGRHETAQAFARELAAACRGSVGIAEVEDVALWMATHVGPRVSSRRLQVAEARARKEATVATPSVEASVPVLPSTVRTLAPHTQLLPTVAAEQETRQFTDGVSVVARTGPRSRRPAFVLAALGAGAIVLLGVAFLLARPPATAQSTGTSTDPLAAAPPPSSSPTSASTPIVAPVALLLRLHANATIVSVRVNGRPVPVGRPGNSVSLELVGFDQASSLAIDAVALDGRRAGIVVPSGASDATLEFRGVAPASAPARPPAHGVAPATTSTAPTAAPLAPSPY